VSCQTRDTAALKLARGAVSWLEVSPMWSKFAAALLIAAAAPSCASLASLRRVIQPLVFDEADGRPAELRLISPSLDRPAGAAGVRVWLAIDNPNPFGVTLSTLRATLLLDEQRAATGEFPLGLALRPGQESVVPLDLSIGLLDIPGLADVIQQAARTGRAPYRLDGTFGVDAGPLGQLTFGPMTLVAGELRAGPP
jgi:hypothetical protein